MAIDCFSRIWRHRSKPSPPGTMTSSRNNNGGLLLGIGEYVVCSRKKAHRKSSAFKVMAEEMSYIRFILHDEDDRLHATILLVNC